MSDDMYEKITEYIYGLEYTKPEYQNTRKKYSLFFNGDRCINIGTQKNSDAFMEFVLDIWTSNERHREKAMKYRKDLKMQKDYDFVCKELENTKEESLNYKSIVDQEYRNKLKDDVENTHPYKNLLFRYKMLNEQVSDCKGLSDTIEKLKEQLSSARTGEATIQLENKEKNDKILNKLKTRLENEYDKKIKDYIRDDEKHNIKNLKDQIKSLESEVKKWKSLAVA